MITVRNVSYSYRDGANQVSALQNVDLLIRKGEWLAISGANGSGKSTLVRMFNGLLLPQSGEIIVDGLDLTKPINQAAVKQKVQVVFQNPDAQSVGTTPVEDIAFGLENRGIPRDEMLARIDKVLNQVGLQHKKYADVATLSGGQKQRLAIASCMALEPDCLIFDEATSMLDPVGRKEIYQIARKLWYSGVTVIWVTQRLEELLKAERILTLNNGQIEYDGDARTLFYGSEIPALYKWDLPSVVKIGLFLKKQGFSLEKLPLCEEEALNSLWELNYQM